MGTPWNFWLPDWIANREAGREARRAGVGILDEAERDPEALNAYWTPADEARQETPLTQAAEGAFSIMSAPIALAKGAWEGAKDIIPFSRDSLEGRYNYDDPAQLKEAAGRAFGSVSTAAIANGPMGALTAQARRATMPGAVAHVLDDVPGPAPLGHNRPPPPEVTGSKELFTDTPATVDGRGPADWGPDDFQAYGEKFGVTEGFGGTSGTTAVKGLDGSTYDIPNSFLRGEKGTYYDQLQLKAAAVNPRNLPPELHSKIHEGLLKTVTPDAADIGPERLFNQQLFGITSPNQPLTPNAFAFGRLMAKSPDDISKIASMTPWSADQIFAVKGGPKSLRAQMSRDITGEAGLGAAKRGGLGASGSADYTRVSDLAKLVERDPDFFSFRGNADSPADWEAHVGRIASQVPGLSYKTGSLGSVFERPGQAQISAIDRHMVRSYKKRGGTDLFESAKDEAAFEKSAIKLANKRRVEAVRALAKKNKKRYRKPEKITRYEDVPQSLIGEQLLQHLNSHKSPKYRLATGELNPNVPSFYSDVQFPVEPPSVAGMSDPYRGVLNANALDAVDRPYGVFGEQWRHWDTLRQRLEPHEWMNPTLQKVGRMNLDQLKLSDVAHNAAGYKAAEGIARPTASPGALAIFANAERSGLPGTLINAQSLQSKEAIPSRVSGHLAGLQDASRSVKDMYSRRHPIMEARPELQSGPSLRGVGAYEGPMGFESNPAMMTPYNLEPRDLNAVGAFDSAMGVQDAAPFTSTQRLQGGDPIDFADVRTVEPLNEAQVLELTKRHPGNSYATIDNSMRDGVRFLGGPGQLDTADIMQAMRDLKMPAELTRSGPGSSFYNDFADEWSTGPSVPWDTSTISSGARRPDKLGVAWVDPAKVSGNVDRRTFFPGSYEDVQRIASGADGPYNVGPAEQMLQRRERLKDFIGSGGRPSLAEIGFADSGKLDFTNGRNRFMLARDAGDPAIPVAAEAGDIARLERDGFMSQPPPWTGTGRVTEKFLADMDKASARTRQYLDSPRSRNAVGRMNLHDRVIAERYGLQTRDDILRMREIFSREGLEGLRAALRRGDALPSNADLGGVIALLGPQEREVE